MARLESDHGRLLISFQYLTRRCREHLGLKDTRENRRVAAGIVRDIELELAGGKFDYATKFPLSRNVERLGLKKCGAPVPSLVDFGQDWIEERRASGRISDATAYDYRRIFEAHVLHSDLGAKQLDDIHDGHINRLIGELRARSGIH